MDRLKDRVAIITGASSGIGLATAKLFVQQGARAVIAARTSERLGRVSREITRQGGHCLTVPTDISNRHQVEHLVQRTLDQFGRIDILLNNAGILTPPTPLAEMKEKDWDQIFNVNLKGVYWTIRCVWPVMEKQGKGIIINTASVVAFKGVAGIAAYCGSKAAVVMMTRALALEGAPLGIRVNCVCPGFIDTPMNEWLGSLQPDRDEWLADMHDQIPLNRSGSPQEIAQASLFLASDDSSYMTGQTMILDGGAIA